MPVGPFSLCLRARIIYAYGPSFCYCFTCCIVYLADDMLSLLSEIQLDILVPSKIPHFIGHVKRPSPRLSLRASLLRTALRPRHLRAHTRDPSHPGPASSAATGRR